MSDPSWLSRHPILLEPPRHIRSGVAGNQQAAVLFILVDLLRPRRILEVGRGDDETYLSLVQAADKLGLGAVGGVMLPASGTRSASDVVPSVRWDAPSDRSSLGATHGSKDRITTGSALSAPIDVFLLTTAFGDAFLAQAFEAAKPYLSDRAVVIFDSIHLRRAESPVSALWNEMRRTFVNREIDFGEGLGLLAFGEAAVAGCPEIFATSEDRWQALTRLFAMVGETTNEVVADRLRSRPDDHQGVGQGEQLTDIDAIRAGLIGRLMVDLTTTSASLNEQSRLLASANEALVEANQHVADVVGSLSWRVTEPLRRAKQRVRRRVSPAARVVRAALARPSDRAEYAAWVAQFDTLSPEIREAIARDVAKLPSPPVISIVMPVFNVAAEHLERAIESVIEQIYPFWELCVADDASTAVHVRPLLERYAAEEERIRVVFRQTNGHISAASNSALALAQGDYVGFLDHDDELAPHALYAVAKELQSFPDAEILYSDEDRIDERGRRFGPHFKPDYNPELLLGQNFVTHFCVYRRSLLESTGGFRLGFEGSQDHDLLLRATARCAPDQIRHIPRVLYHWRAIPGSVALSVDEKPYAGLAGRRAVEEHVRALDPGAEVLEGPNPVVYRARFSLPQKRPLVSIIVPTRNGVGMLRRCIDSVFDKTTYRPFELIVMDNGTDEPASLEYLDGLERQQHCTVLRDTRPFNYAALNNAAAERARGEFLLLLNNDTEVITPEWLDEMVRWGVRPGIGTVGAKLLYEDGTLQHGGLVLGIGGIAGHSHKAFPGDSPGYFGRLQIAHQVGGNTGACLLVRRSVYLEHGGLDAKNLKVSYNDVDFCIRLARSGLRHIWTPFAVLSHYESKSRGSDEAPGNRGRAARERHYMRWRWRSDLEYDPAYSSNLTNGTQDFGLAWPPRVPPLEVLAGP